MEHTALLVGRVDGRRPAETIGADDRFIVATFAPWPGCEFT